MRWFFLSILTIWIFSLTKAAAKADEMSYKYMSETKAEERIKEIDKELESLHRQLGRSSDRLKLVTRIDELEKERGIIKISVWGDWK